jgi:hypothetical protein
LASIASGILIGWGTAHLVPTFAVAESFGEISLDSRRILVMEWVAGGITHISIGVLVIPVTAIEGAADATTDLLYALAAGVLLVLAGLTIARGARTPVIGFRICPFVLTGAAVLSLVASSL